MSDKTIWGIIWTLLGAGLIIAVGFICIDMESIKANEVGVVYKWKGGVDSSKEPLHSGVKFVWFGKIHKVDIGTQKLSFAKQTENDIAGKDTADNEYDRIVVICGNDGGQEAFVTLSMTYNVSSKGAVRLTNDGIQAADGTEGYKYVILKRIGTEVVNEVCRPQDALDIYSGDGFNRMKEEVQNRLMNHPALIERGINVENAAVFAVNLDPAYEEEIKQKQLAKQTTLRAKEDEKAAVAKAAQAKAEAQAMVEKRSAEARAKKIEQVTQAEADAEKTVLAAEAAKKQKVLNAEAEAEQTVLAAKANAQELEQQGLGEMKRDQAAAEGVLALGNAQAEVEEALKKAMYDGEAGQRRALVEVTSNQADKLAGMLEGVNVIPQDAFVAMSTEGANIPVRLTKEVGE